MFSISLLYSIRSHNFENKLLSLSLSPALYPPYTRITPTLYPPYTRLTPALYPPYTRITPTLYPHYTRIIPALYPPYTRLTPVLHPLGVEFNKLGLPCHERIFHYVIHTDVFNLYNYITYNVCHDCFYLLSSGV